MRKTVSIIGLLIISTSVAAQEKKPAGNWAASLTGAFIPLPEFNFGIQPGIQYRFNDRFSLLTELTIRVGNRADKDSEAVDKEYFRIQPELRYQLSGKKRKQQLYTGLRLSYALRRFSDVNNGFYSTESANGSKGIYYDRAKVSSPVFTSSIQLGTIIGSGKKLTADLFAGLGARFIKTTYSDVINPVNGTRNRPSDGPVFYASYSYNGSLVWLHLNAGFRLLYHLGK